jgi:endonuclease YncB( thermonuclease family)
MCFGSSLSKRTEENTEWLSFDGQVLTVKCVSVYDADTITIIVPLRDGYYKTKARLYGIDTAEKRTSNAKEKEVALEGTKFVESKLLNKTFKVACGDWDKYGRLLVTVYVEWERSLNKEIVEKGYGYAYDGGTKKKFDEWYSKTG